MASRCTMYTRAIYDTRAGTRACLMMSVYEIPVNSEMRNAAAPITGGVNWPLVDEATSTAPAFSGVKPVRFIRGMVKVPVVTVLAMEDPE